MSNAKKGNQGPGTTELLEELLADAPDPKPGEPEPKIRFEDLLKQFQRRAFGVYLLVMVLPAFFAVAPGVGGVSGALCILCGLQMIAGFESPWIPKFARNFGLPRKSLSNFARRTERWFRWLEKVIKTRQPAFTSRNADRFTGLIILLMGIALFLPIPLTNFFFAIPLLVLAFALIERDGWLIAICWASSIIVMVLFALLGDALFHWVLALFK
jgi:hypothetical protein